MSDGNGNGTDSAATTSGALMRRDRPQEKNEIERRRRFVAQWRFVLRLTESEIVTRLAKLDPPIVTTRTTISRDVQGLRSTFRQYFSQRNFDPRAEVGIVVAGIDHIVSKSFRDARRSTDGRERALHRKVALDALEKLATLYQDVGLVNQRDFQLPPDDGKRADRVPSGHELQQLFDSISVNPSELVSEAETAWLYGDAARSERAALDTTNGSSRTEDDPDGMN